MPEPASHTPNKVLDRRHPRLLDFGVLLILVVGFILIQLQYLRPPIISDQLDYFHAAFELPEASPTHRHLRIGLLFPVRLGIALFDYSEAAYYLVPFLSGIGFLLSTYFLGRVLFGSLVGLTAASVTTFSPLFFLDSSELLIDIPAAACFTGAMAAILHSGRLLETKTGKPLVWLGAAGALLAWTYLIRGPVAVILLPLVLISVVLGRIPMRALIWLVGSALGILTIELLWGALVYGEPFIRIETLLERHDRGTASGNREQTRGGENFVTDTLLDFPQILISQMRGLVPMSLGVLLGVGWLWMRDRRLGFLIIWSAGVWAGLTALGLAALLRTTIPRYWFAMYPPLIVGGIAVITLTMRKFSRRHTTPAVLILTVTLTGFGLWQIDRMPQRTFPQTTHYEEFRTWLASEGGKNGVIWTDELTARLIPAYTRSTFGQPIWNGDIRSVQEEDSSRHVSQPSLGWALVHATGIRKWNQSHSNPSYLTSPPSDWDPVWFSQDGEMVVYDTAPG